MVICRSLYKISKDHTWQFNPNFHKNSDLYPPGDFRGGWPQVFRWLANCSQRLLANDLSHRKTLSFPWALYHHVGGQIVAQPLETGHLVTWSRGMLKIRKECFFSAKIELCQVKGWNHGIFGLGNIHRYFSREKPYQSNGPRFLWSAWSQRASSALLLHMTPMTHREICVHDSSMSYRMKTTQKYVYIIHASTCLLMYISVCLLWNLRNSSISVPFATLRAHFPFSLFRPTPWPSHWMVTCGESCSATLLPLPLHCAEHPPSPKIPCLTIIMNLEAFFRFPVQWGHEASEQRTWLVD